MISMGLTWPVHGYSTAEGPHKVHGSRLIIATPNLAAAIEVVGSNNVDFGNVRCRKWGGWIFATAD